MYRCLQDLLAPAYLSFLMQEACWKDYMRQYGWHVIRDAYMQTPFHCRPESIWRWVKESSGKTAETLTLSQSSQMRSIFLLFRLHHCHPVLFPQPLVLITFTYTHFLFSRVTSFILSSSVNISRSLRKFLPLKIPLLLWIPLQMSDSVLKTSL